VFIYSIESITICRLAETQHRDVLNGKGITKTSRSAVEYPGILFGGGGKSNSVEDRGQRERGAGGGSNLVRGSGGSCNLVKEISFHVVKFSQFLVL